MGVSAQSPRPVTTLTPQEPPVDGWRTMPCGRRRLSFAGWPPIVAAVHRRHLAAEHPIEPLAIDMQSVPREQGKGIAALQTCRGLTSGREPCPRNKPRRRVPTIPQLRMPRGPRAPAAVMR